MPSPYPRSGRSRCNRPTLKRKPPRLVYNFPIFPSGSSTLSRPPPSGLAVFLCDFRRVAIAFVGYPRAVSGSPRARLPAPRLGSAPCLVHFLAILKRKLPGCKRGRRASLRRGPVTLVRVPRELTLEPKFKIFGTCFRSRSRIRSRSRSRIRRASGNFPQSAVICGHLTANWGRWILRSSFSLAEVIDLQELLSIYLIFADKCGHLTALCQPLADI